MSVLCIDFFVLCCNVDLEVSISFPLLLMKLNFGNLFTENGFTDDGSEKAVTDVLVLFILIHEVTEKNREVDNIKEKCLYCHLE